jgi:hypothetical protein
MGKARIAAMTVTPVRAALNWRDVSDEALAAALI